MVVRAAKMPGGDKCASLLIVSEGALSNAAVSALEACAERLGHGASLAFLDASVLDAQNLLLSVHECDPWDVVAVDEPSSSKLREAFGEAASALAPDAPVEARGYRIVAVPGFEDCLDDQPSKRVAWERLKAAVHPKAPY